MGNCCNVPIDNQKVEGDMVPVPTKETDAADNEQDTQSEKQRTKKKKIKLQTRGPNGSKLGPKSLPKTNFPKSTVVGP